MTTRVAAGTAMVRAIFRSIVVPGRSESIFAKLYYPALYTGSDEEINFGRLPPAPADRAWPVVILMPGINVGPEAYGWLAEALAEAGFVTLLYGWIVEEMPGAASLSPGLDIGALAPDAYGETPSATALGAILADLAAVNADGLLAGRLDLDRIVLGGHSAGGSVALFNARSDWFAGLRAAFAYGAHSKTSTMLGYPPGTIAKLPGELPLMILGGSEDGVIAASVFRYGEAEGEAPDPAEPLRRTMDEGVVSDRGDCLMAILRGANHFSFCWPADTATGRPFLDWPETRDNAALRADLAALVVNFARARACDDTDADNALRHLIEDADRVSEFAIR